jgi:hypothetical protein
MIRVVLRCCIAALLAIPLGCTGGTGRLNLSDQQRTELKKAASIEAVHWQQGLGLVVSFPSGLVFRKEMCLEDPIAIAKERVLSALATQYDFANMQSVSIPVVWPHRGTVVRRAASRTG